MEPGAKLSQHRRQRHDNRIDRVREHIELLRLHRRERHNNGIDRVREHVGFLRLHRRECTPTAGLTESEGTLSCTEESHDKSEIDRVRGN